MNIAMYDTSISDSNLGNQIIVDAVLRELDMLFPNYYLFKLPCMEITEHTLKIIGVCEYSFFAGTNAINGNLEDYTQMGINKKNIKFINNFVSIGLGWWQYQDKISKFSMKLLNELFKNNVMHSVRDEYTKNKLASIGINNVLNTGCPTLWELKENGYPREKSENVIFTVTDYNQDINRDTFFISFLHKNYKNVYCFLQGERDYVYLEKNHLDNNVKFISPRLSFYDKFLENNDVDYIGTRLHAGIRALQHGKKSLILGIDNRSLEMKKDFSIPVVPLTDINNISGYIDGDIQINLPKANIEMWRNQFKNNRC